MDTLTGSEAARRLRTNLPRLKRAIDRLGLEVEELPAGRVRVDEAQLERLRNELGVVPQLDGLSRVETQLLAALARAPRGLAGTRALSRRSGVSPTAAARALCSLTAGGLVRRERQWVAAGRARELELIRANVTAPGWPPLAAQLAHVQLPEQPKPSRPRRLPARLGHLFWNADPNRLDLHQHGDYIAERILTSHDLDGLAWAAYALNPADWKNAARNRGLSPQERALAHNLANDART